MTAYDNTGFPNTPHVLFRQTHSMPLGEREFDLTVPTNRTKNCYYFPRWKKSQEIYSYDLSLNCVRGIMSWEHYDLLIIFKHVGKKVNLFEFVQCILSSIPGHAQSNQIGQSLQSWSWGSTSPAYFVTHLSDTLSSNLMIWIRCGK